MQQVALQPEPFGRRAVGGTRRPPNPGRGDLGRAGDLKCANQVER